MYPSETSLIPVTVALTKFLETNGLKAIFSNYPYWYLGSTPFRFLTGPIIPVFLSIFHKLLPNTSLFILTIYLIAFSFLLSAFGWTILWFQVSSIKHQGGKTVLHTTFYILLFLIFPWRLFASLTLEEGSFTIARNLMPLALLAIWSHFAKKDLKSKTWAVLAVSALLLINTSVLPILLTGVAALALAFSFNDGKIRGLGKRIKSCFLILLASLLLSTIYYFPTYWLSILANPSIGGASGIKVVLRVLDLLKASAPLFLAIFAVCFSGKVKNRLSVFILTWTFTFLFLTIFRFIGDWDFWMDWTSWMYEIEIGIVLLIVNSKFSILNFKKHAPYLTLLASLFLLPFYLTWRIYLALDRPPLISNQVPRGVRSLDKLDEVVGSETTFLSGSSVFWANALYDIYQVRGGRDQVATDPNWNKAAYEVREGKSPEKTKEWLNKLKVSFVMVHTPASFEYYHDFKNLDKWEKIGKVIWQGNGDIIYKVYK